MTHEYYLTTKHYRPSAIAATWRLAKSAAITKQEAGAQDIVSIRSGHLQRSAVFVSYK